MNYKKKADKEVSKYYKGLPCKVCESQGIENTHATCGHHIVSRSIAYYRHHPHNLIPLCPRHHKFSNEIAPHSSNVLAVEAFVKWLRKHYKVGYKCLKNYKQHLGEKVDYEKAYYEWKDLNNSLDKSE
jgi:hypothetical protein